MAFNSQRTVVMKNLLKKIFCLNSLIIFLTFLLIGANSFYLLASIMVTLHSDIKILEPGTQFIAFKERLKDIKQLGYLTNKDMSEENNDSSFLQAQYMLAPTILDLNNSNYPLNILDYPDPVHMIFKLRGLNARPARSSPYGQVLAEKKQ